MRQIFKPKMLIYQSKAILYGKTLFGIFHISEGFVLELNIPCSVLVHDLCGIEVQIASFGNGILISIAGEL